MPLDKGRTILVVDDENDILITMKKVLQSEGYSVSTAMNADEALSLLDSSTVDLIITDIRMPGTDGIQLAKMVKEKDRTVQVIIMTGQSKVENPEKLVVPLDSVGLLRKPFNDIDQLFNLVELAMDKRIANPDI